MYSFEFVGFQNERNKTTLILKVRSRIEELERKFLTRQMLDTYSRREKWDNILNKQTRFFRRNIELQQFRASVTIANDVFINTVVLLYGDFSDIAAHMVFYPIPHTRDAIKQMFEDLGITADHAKVRIVETILQPIVLP